MWIGLFFGFRLGPVREAEPPVAKSHFKNYSTGVAGNPKGCNGIIDRMDKLLRYFN